MVVVDGGWLLVIVVVGDVVGDAVVVVVVVVGELPQIGNPGSCLSSCEPAKNKIGTHTPGFLLSCAQAHQWLVWLPTEYVDPGDWHRNHGRLLAGRVPNLFLLSGK